MKKKCIGCGVELQHSNKDKEGFVPKDVIGGKGKLVCKRCFRIKNYGDYIPVEFTEDDYLKIVSSTLNKLDVIVLVVDIIDFEGSFNEKIIKLVKNKPIIIAVNKIDLIPSMKHPTEVGIWVKKRFAKFGVNPLDIGILSVEKGYGVSGILKKLKHFYKDGAEVGIVGVTNVGKSSLINKLFYKKDFVTVSKYPGTTLNVVRNKIPDTDFYLIDTPGIIPKGRISDLVCEDCNLTIVPSNEISRKTFKLEKDRVLMFGGLAQIKVLNDGDIKPIFIAFASKNVKFHETNESRIQDLLDNHTGDMLNPPCEKCKEKYYNLEMKKEIVEAEEGQEIALKGLGWLTVRRGPLKVEITLPKIAEIVVREAFIGGK